MDEDPTASINGLPCKVGNLVFGINPSFFLTEGKDLTNLQEFLTVRMVGRETPSVSAGKRST